MAQSQMTLSLFSQRITTPKSNPTSLNFTPSTHKKNPNFTIKAESANGDHLQRASIKTSQQKQPTKKILVQSPPIGLWDMFPIAITVQQMMDTMEEPPSHGEGEEDYKLRFDIPGMTKEDVKVWVEEKMLVLKAEKLKKDDNNINGESDRVWSSESYGKYSFRIALPRNIQFEKIKAEVRDGVLYVTIPKALVSSKILDINVQ
ncbi:hypothetical protein L1987_11284 [Smallanthus sonchifolius]|uniref:Uncharacterized protein n=1 Tax=Smallanthus sonchifolius TaxID=185202 RepID=A0ACB9JAW1_9ASTR|nr:hypothetical protein L1987_11284 [Smallanthus sonchifolius]